VEVKTHVEQEAQVEDRLSEDDNEVEVEGAS
jgi:hypothetical protein